MADYDYLEPTSAPAKRVSRNSIFIKDLSPEAADVVVERQPLRIGDIVYLTRTFMFDDKQHTVNLIGEGLSDTCNVVDFAQFKPNAVNRYCLFRVEPSFNYKNQKFTPVVGWVGGGCASQSSPLRVRDDRA